MWTKCIQDTEMAYVILTKPFIQNLDYTGKIILKEKRDLRYPILDLNLLCNQKWSFIWFSWGRVSLCSSGCSKAHYIDHVGLLISHRSSCLCLLRVGIEDVATTSLMIFKNDLKTLDSLASTSQVYGVLWLKPGHQTYKSKCSINWCVPSTDV